MPANSTQTYYRIIHHAKKVYLLSCKQDQPVHLRESHVRMSVVPEVITHLFAVVIPIKSSVILNDCSNRVSCTSVSTPTEVAIDSPI